jgi:hypothetical protein
VPDVLAWLLVIVLFVLALWLVPFSLGWLFGGAWHLLVVRPIVDPLRRRAWRRAERRRKSGDE